MSYQNVLHVKNFLFIAFILFNFISVAGSDQSEIDYYRSRTVSAPNDATAQYNLGVAYSKTGKTEESIKAFEKAIELNPNNIKALVALGQIYEGEGVRRYRDKVALNKARVYYEKALEKDPKDRYVRRLLAHVYLNQGKRREGIYHLILTGWNSVYGLAVETFIVVLCISVLLLRKNRLLQVKIFRGILVVSILSLAIPILRPATLSTGIPIGLAALISLVVLVQRIQLKENS